MRNAEKQNTVGFLFRTPHSEIRVGHASGFVLRRPVIVSPPLRWPRFSRRAVRSKRLRTLRLPPKVEAARRLRCCDINILLNLLLKRAIRIAELRHAAMGNCAGVMNFLYPEARPE